MKYVLLILSVLLVVSGYSQYMYVSSDKNDIYQFDLSGTCSSTFFSNCTPPGSDITDLAVDAFGKLYICRNDSIFLQSNSSTACVFVTNFNGLTIKSIEIGPDGRLYAVGKNLIRYDFNSGQLTNLGQLPQGIADAGGLVFYLTRLFMSTVNGSIYEININDPASSQVYYDPKIAGLKGLVIAPARCAGATSDELRLFAFENVANGHTLVHIIDMEKKITYYNYCTANLTIVGNSGFHPSTVVTSPIASFSVTVTPASCSKTSDGRIEFGISNIPVDIDAYSFSLDNNIQNTTGVFADLKAGSYQVRLQNKMGCFSDTIIVIPALAADCRDSLFVPTAFTPNADGKNDVFKARSFIRYTDFQMQVFNRDGQRVFQSNAMSDGWDGTIRGVIPVSDVYIWLIRYKNLNGQTIYRKGQVALLH